MSAKLCKFGCGQMLSWDTATSSFKEQDGTPHTKERCTSLQAKSSPPTNAAAPASSNSSDISKMHEENMVANRLLVAAINRLAAAIEVKKA